MSTCSLSQGLVVISIRSRRVGSCFFLIVCAILPNHKYDMSNSLGQFSILAAILAATHAGIGVATRYLLVVPCSTAVEVWTSSEAVLQKAIQETNCTGFAPVDCGNSLNSTAVSCWPPILQSTEHWANTVFILQCFFSGYHVLLWSVSLFLRLTTRATYSLIS